jgi:MSHA biogenesis protein MshL
MAALAALSLSACSPMLSRDATYQSIQESLRSDTKSSAPESVEAALTPTIVLAVPEAEKAPEPRFDISVSGAPAAQVFQAVVNDTSYTMLVPPDISGVITLNLKNVTVPEALEIIRDLYGYDFKIKGRRITVQSNTAQTRIFQVSYLASRRGGTSMTRVTSSGTPSYASGSNNSSSSSNGSSGSMENTNVLTVQLSDFWAELGMGIASVLGCDFTSNSGASGDLSALKQNFSSVKCPEGKRFVMNQQSGAVLVRALPSELQEVADLLKSMQLSIDRQVMLEAKIVEVELSDGFQSGVNWLGFDRKGRYGGVNVNTDYPPGTTTANFPRDSGQLDYSALTGPTGLLHNLPSASLGLALQTRNFSSVIQFLETQGTVYVMSSPRIATLNNQKAVLKVGSEDYYVTHVEPGENNNSSSNNNSYNAPTIEASPFFSGIALDVTPQIAEDGMIALHIRPAVTEVTSRNLVVDFGQQGTYQFPFASSRVKETDSIVRIRDGMIVAIGGLMSQEQSAGEDRVPGAGQIPLLGSLFKQAQRSMRKRELVVLIKPTVIKDETDWQEDLDAVRNRLNRFDPKQWPALGSTLSGIPE